MPGPILCASPCDEDPLSRSYGVSLPSSLTMNLSTPQYVLPDYVCPFAVRVPLMICLADFLGSLITLTIAPPEGFAYFQGRLKWWICLPLSIPTLFNGLFRQTAEVSLLRLHIAYTYSNVILNVSSIGLALRLILRSRLTLNRLTLFRKP